MSQKTKSSLTEVASETFQMHGPVLRFRYCDGRSVPSSDMSSDMEPDAELDAQRSVEPVTQPKTGTRRRLTDLTDTTVQLDQFMRLPFSDGSAGTIICCDTLPYVESAKCAVDELHRVLSPDGLLLVQVRANLGERDPWLWQPSPQGLTRLLDRFDASVIGWHGATGRPHTLYAAACRQDAVDRFGSNVNQFIAGLQQRLLAPQSPAQSEHASDELNFMVHMPSGRLDWLFL